MGPCGSLWVPALREPSCLDGWKFIQCNHRVIVTTWNKTLTLHIKVLFQERGWERRKGKEDQAGEEEPHAPVTRQGVVHKARKCHLLNLVVILAFVSHKMLNLKHSLVLFRAS